MHNAPASQILDRIVVGPGLCISLVLTQRPGAASTSHITGDSGKQLGIAYAGRVHPLSMEEASQWLNAIRDQPTRQIAVGGTYLFRSNDGVDADLEGQQVRVLNVNKRWSFIETITGKLIGYRFSALPGELYPLPING